jgi:hypothetical protein
MTLAVFENRARFENRILRGVFGMATGLLVLGCLPAEAQQSAESLAAAVQNPVAAMYSLPLQNNIYTGGGPDHNKTANVLNIQPVLPFTLGGWNIISRTIAPIIYLPSLTTGLSDITTDSPFDSSHFGLGDINETVYFSPTATSKAIGSGKVSMGPGAVALVMPKPWVIGLLARQLWSVAGEGGRPEVSQLLLQPFVNYNLAKGWYLSAGPIITCNWNASSGNRWNVPFGGGGRIFKIGSQPLNTSLSAYYSPIRPSGGPEWNIRFQVQFLFPRG